MAVIDFLPDRLNNPPVVWKGFTSGEFLLAAVTGILAGLPLAVPLSLVPFIGWLAFPTCMLLTPLVVVFLGGISSSYSARLESYIGQRMEGLRCRARLSRSMILDSRVWEMKRGAPVKRGGQV
ncbi:TIGR03750 family conjugal transfer protein [Erwinia pyrifoliae]|uniref:TIGR03750 family conjugal transfer protein n=1 Tax=Erwinia pyrifoliae TaxID=79967 RepID=UPI0034D95792